MGPASDKADVKFSYKKYYSLRGIISKSFREKFYSDMQIDPTAQILDLGNTQPAVVVATNPLRIAAYSDEMDAVVMLKFPEELSARYELAPGSRLTASVCCFTGDRCAADIFPGAGYSRRYADFIPVIQLFLGKDDEKIRRKAGLFGKESWDRVHELAAAYEAAYPTTFRDGFYYFKKQ